MKKVLYLHGLESKQGGPKVDFLADNCYVYAPEMDYTQKDIFPTFIQIMKDFNPDLIIGSSMGGYFAMLLATHIKTKVVAFNPALHSRTINIEGAKSGKEKLEGLVVLGKNDDIINPSKTIEILENIDNDLSISIEKEMKHRVPLNIFINKTINEL